MTDARTSTRPRARRRSRGRFIVAVVVVVALVGTAVLGAWLALVNSTSGRSIIGGPAVVPDELRSVVKKAAKRCAAVPLEVFAAQINAESGWDPKAVSPAGAQGIAQFMPEVWDQYGIDGDQDGKADVWNPVDAIHSAAELNCINRRLVRDASGDRLDNTLAAYNAGYGSVLKYDGVPPFPETEAYVERIRESARTIVIDERAQA